MQQLLILGYFGAGNFGDDALLAHWLSRREAWLRERDLGVDVLSRDPAPLAGFVEGTRLGPLIRRTVSVREALKVNPREYVALIAPGGSLIQDATSLRSALFYLWMIRRFARYRTPVFLLNQGIGPLRSWLARTQTPRALAECRVLTLRDQASFEWCLARPWLAPHPAMLHSADPLVGGGLEALVPNGLARESYVLVLPRSTGDLPCPRDPATEPQALAALVRGFTGLSGLKAVFAPLQPTHDAEFCREAAQLAQGEVYRFTRGEDTRSSELLGLIGQAALVVSYRLHGLIAAAAAGVPALGVAYDPKIEAFCAEAGLPDCYPATVHQAEAAADLKRLWANKSEVCEVLAERVAEMVGRWRLAEAKFEQCWEAMRNRGK